MLNETAVVVGCELKIHIEWEGDSAGKKKGVRNTAGENLLYVPDKTVAAQCIQPRNSKRDDHDRKCVYTNYKTTSQSVNNGLMSGKYMWTGSIGDLLPPSHYILIYPSLFAHS